MALVELRNVTKKFHKGGETITPLDDISLDVEEGEFVSLMGASGTGKSTLLNLIAGIDRPDAGNITIDGDDITKLSRTNPRSRCRRLSMLRRSRPAANSTTTASPI